MKYLVISCSLRAESRSSILAERAYTDLIEQPVDVEWIDLREHHLPLCDGGASYNLPEVQAMRAKIAAADGVVLAIPVYNYSCNSVAKNLIELTGSAWDNKVVGFLYAGGSNKSYMSPMSLIASLMLDFRVVVLPRFVYATEEDFEGEQIVDTDLLGRIAELSKYLVWVTMRLMA